MSNPILTKNYTAGAIVGPNLIVKWGAADFTVIQSAAAADKHIGVSRGAGNNSAAIATASGDQIDIVVKGEYEVVCGTAGVTRGDPITADANGKAVTAVDTNPIVGFAKQSAVSGDLFLVDVNPSIF